MRKARGGEAARVRCGRYAPGSFTHAVQQQSSARGGESAVFLKLFSYAAIMARAARGMVNACAASRRRVGGK